MLHRFPDRLLRWYVFNYCIVLIIVFLLPDVTLNGVSGDDAMCAFNFNFFYSNLETVVTKVS